LDHRLIVLMAGELCLPKNLIGGLLPGQHGSLLGSALRLLRCHL
jgi:hypothetical protein